MLENKFYKVGQSGGSLVSAYFFNPVTNEEKSEIVRDYDYSDCSRDNDKLYYMPINDEARRAWNHHNGVIDVGAVVEVFKGRKIPVGTVARVARVFDFYDKYDRFAARYVVFEDGRKTNISNCRIV